MEAGPPETGAAQPETAAADLVPRRGYQEYAIQQTPYEQPMKSSRYNISFFVILARGWTQVASPGAGSVRVCLPAGCSQRLMTSQLHSWVSLYIDPYCTG